MEIYCKTKSLRRPTWYTIVHRNVVQLRMRQKRNYTVNKR